MDIIGRQKVGRIKIPLFVEDAIDNTAMEMKMRIQRFTEPLQECHRVQPATIRKIGAVGASALSTFKLRMR
ncbi:MAG: hypothetical protein A3I15_04570 [Chlamydiae bacterium RIFCSPLOWO2_02_FULL_49_12]|nr:MAG: hypothetical protein A3I15_04570 [Chlamydiae bacterium RIFCSPLOWO2_02_FULL_49_12]